MNVPAWSEAVVNTIVREAHLTVEGARIDYLVAGPAGPPPVVFVHGATANAAWWWPVAARFAQDRRVVVLNLSGHGTSEHRPKYTIDGWVREIAAVLEHESAGQPVVLAGHSVGGLVCIGVAAGHRTLVEQLVLCDTLMFEPGAEIVPVDRRGMSGRPGPQFASIAEARSRFRTTPPQERFDDAVLDHVVPRSLTPSGKGWTWSFDREILVQLDETSAARAWPWLRRVSCPIVYLRSEHGVSAPAVVDLIAEHAGAPVSVATLPGAGHHPMLDRPDDLYRALRGAIVGSADPANGGDR